MFGAYLHKMPQSSDNFDEQAAWSRIRQGNKEAFLQLYEQFFHYLLSIGIRISGDPHAAKDACQDYFMYLWEKRNTLSDVRNIKGYLYRGYKNQLMKMIVKSGRAAGPSFETENDTPHLWTASPEADWIHIEDANKKLEALVRAFKILPPRQRELLYLRYYSAMPIDDIAGKTGLSIRSVYNQLHIAHNKLKTVLLNKSGKNFPGFLLLFFF